ncbi:hypothetical protein H4Q26_010018 [Puccinia striiformis f. sp. tritici PST-130]|nr:hypothetical protein H4Q26_010018 [Puccinia striiformis f. sp. tritici PST-130]
MFGAAVICINPNPSVISRYFDQYRLSHPPVINQPPPLVKITSQPCLENAEQKPPSLPPLLETPVKVSRLVLNFLPLASKSLVTSLGLLHQQRTPAIPSHSRRMQLNPPFRSHGAKHLLRARNSAGYQASTMVPTNPGDEYFVPSQSQATETGNSQSQKLTWTPAMEKSALDFELLAEFPGNDFTEKKTFKKWYDAFLLWNAATGALRRGAAAEEGFDERGEPGIIKAMARMIETKAPRIVNQQLPVTQTKQSDPEGPVLVFVHEEVIVLPLAIDNSVAIICWKLEMEELWPVLGLGTRGKGEHILSDPQSRTLLSLVELADRASLAAQRD